MEDPRLSALDRLQDELTNLLAVLDTMKHDAGAGVDRAWNNCHAAFEEYLILDESLDTAPPTELRGRIEDIVRLHAIATDRVREWMTTLGGERARLARTRAQLKSIAGEARTGDSCNVAG